MDFNCDWYTIGKGAAFVSAGLCIIGALFYIAAAVDQKFMKAPRIGTLENEPGAEAVTVSQTGPAGGKVMLGGVYWDAFSDVQIPENIKVVIVERTGLRLKVQRASLQ